MKRAEILKAQVDWYKNKINEKNIKHVYVVPLLNKLSGKQLEQLQNGSGNPISEMFQINSSAGLAINYYKLFEEVIKKQNKNFEIEFEWKESTPLLDSIAPANIDVRFELNNTIYFVESKFHESYCDLCEKIDDSSPYLDFKRYKISETSQVWIDLFKEIQREIKSENFLFYNITQLSKHLLAIYVDFNENLNKYNNKNIVLQSVTWEMPVIFEQHFNTMKLNNGDLNSRKNVLEVESKKCVKILNNFIQNKLNWGNCKFETKHYNDTDMQNDIVNAKGYDKFKLQYFF